MGKALHNRVERWLEVHSTRQDHYEQSDELGSFLHVNSPNALASFVAFCRFPLRDIGLRVFMRGESRRHKPLVPSLFRGSTDRDESSRRYQAYTQFIARLPKLVTGERWKRPNIGAVLQHYGLKTQWIDVLDDLSTAIWFALHEFVEGDTGWVAVPSCEEFGWIHFIVDDRGAFVADLRSEHSSMNWRCHAQQGWSIARACDRADFREELVELEDLVIATARIQNSSRWKLSGFRASSGYFFPASADDNTYRQLLNAGCEAHLGELEDEFQLSRETLGRVLRYQEVSF